MTRILLYKYQTKSGTIGEKNRLSRLIIKEIKAYDDLSEEAKELAEILYEFIEESNK